MANEEIKSCQSYREDSSIKEDPWRGPHFFADSPDSIDDYRNNIPGDPKLLNHNPSEYYFCEENGRYAAIYPSPKREENGVLIDQIKVKYWETQAKYLKVLKDFPQSPSLVRRVVTNPAFAAAAGLGGGLYFGQMFSKGTQEANLWGKRSLLKGGYLAIGSRGSPKVTAGQQLMSWNSNSCSAFNKMVEHLKDLDRVQLISGILAAGVLITEQLVVGGLIADSLSKDESESADIHKQSYMILSDSTSFPDDNEIRGMNDEKLNKRRIALYKLLSDKKNELLKLEAESAQFAHPNESWMESPILWAATGVTSFIGGSYTFGIMVPVSSWLDKYKLFSSSARAAGILRQNELTEIAWQAEPELAMAAMISAYANLCGEQPKLSLVPSPARAPVGLPTVHTSTLSTLTAAVTGAIATTGHFIDEHKTGVLVTGALVGVGIVAYATGIGEVITLVGGLARLGAAILPELATAAPIAIAAVQRAK